MPDSFFIGWSTHHENGATRSRTLMSPKLMGGGWGREKFGSVDK